MMRQPTPMRTERTGLQGWGYDRSWVQCQGARPSKAWFVAIREMQTNPLERSRVTEPARYNPGLFFLPPLGPLYPSGKTMKGSTSSFRGILQGGKDQRP
jgi:hypothetical protein